jgi:hypothetical protein
MISGQAAQGDDKRLLTASDGVGNTDGIFLTTIQARGCIAMVSDV